MLDEVPEEDEALAFGCAFLAMVERGLMCLECGDDLHVKILYYIST